MPGPLGILGMQAASQGLSAGMGLLLQGINDRRQLRQQQKLQDMQIKGDKQITDYNALKQMEMWRNTNYPAQMAMLKAAGLNPALIYEGGGQGGSTAITQGNVTGAAAPTGGQEIQQMMAMGLTRDLQLAQIENIKATTEKTKAETQKTTGVDTQLAQQTIEGIKQTIQSQQTQQALTRAQTALTDLDAQFASATMENRKSIVNLQLSKIIEEVSIIENDRQISDATKQDAINTIKREALQVYLENQLIKSQTALTDEQKNVAQQQIKTMIATIEQHRWSISNEKLKTELQHFREMGLGDNDDFKEILRGLGIILPIPGNKTRTVVEGFKTGR